MASQYNPKILAKTLTSIAVHTPDDAGLFWNPDGTMPWKELYWALQEDPDLRFVRETHLREIGYLGIEIPFALENGMLVLKKDVPPPTYPQVDDLPARLYYACLRKRYPFVQEHGLSATNRPLLPLAANAELALRISKRRDEKPILIEVLTEKALGAGVIFRTAGTNLYLVEHVPVASIQFPLLRQDSFHKPESKKEKKAAPPALSPTPGSFFMDLKSFQPQEPEKTKGSKGKRGPDWKRDSRKERSKRTV